MALACLVACLVALLPALLLGCLVGWLRSVGEDGLSGWERGRKAAVAGIHVAGW